MILFEYLSNEILFKITQHCQSQLLVNLFICILDE